MSSHIPSLSTLAQPRPPISLGPVDLEHPSGDESVFHIILNPPPPDFCILPKFDSLSLQLLNILSIPHHLRQRKTLRIRSFPPYKDSLLLTFSTPSFSSKSSSPRVA